MNSSKARKEESLRIANSTRLAAQRLKASTDEYLTTFDAAKQFSFSDAKNNKAKYEYNYYSYASSIIEVITELSALNAELSSLLILADQKMDIELIPILQKRFDVFLLFEKSLYHYTSTVEKAFDEGAPTITFLINAANKFKLSIENLITENT